jgi:hypothetical protein
MASPRWTTARRARLGAPGCVALATLIVVAAACSDAVTPSQPGFCRRVTANLDALRNVADPTQAGKTLDAYRKVAVVAPAGVRDAWTTLTAVIESAATKDISQPGAEAAFAQRILTSKPAIDTILAYTKDNCGIDLAAPPPTTAAATTVPPPTTVAPAPETTAPDTTASVAPTSTAAESSTTSSASTIAGTAIHT